MENKKAQKYLKSNEDFVPLEKQAEKN